MHATNKCGTDYPRTLQPRELTSTNRPSLGHKFDAKTSAHSADTSSDARQPTRASHLTLYALPRQDLPTKLSTYSHLRTRACLRLFAITRAPPRRGQPRQYHGEIRNAT
jgi:hypothetical protein